MTISSGAVPKKKARESRGHVQHASTRGRTVLRACEGLRTGGIRNLTGAREHIERGIPASACVDRLYTLTIPPYTRFVSQGGGIREDLSRGREIASERGGKLPRRAPFEKRGAISHDCGNSGHVRSNARRTRGPHTSSPMPYSRRRKGVSVRRSERETSPRRGILRCLE